MSDKPGSPDWLGDLRWQGYPRLQPIADVASRPDPTPDLPARPGRKPSDVRLEGIARENESLRAQIDALSRLASEFEHRLSDAGQEYEKSILEADCARRDAELDLARAKGELEAARAELGRLAAREANKSSELALERERRSDCERALIDSRRRITELENEIRSLLGKIK